jgi:predicted transcriptional regulator
MADPSSTSETKRSSAMKIVLHPDMAQKLQVLADQLGQTPAILASVAVSQYVAQQTAALGVTQRVVEDLFNHIAPEVLSALQMRFGSATLSSKPDAFEEQRNASDSFHSEEQGVDLQRGRSSSEALSEVLKQSAALVNAEEGGH